MGELWRRIWYLLNRSRFERELRDEMDAHRAMKREAEPRFGNARRLLEDAGDEWGWAWLDRLAQDLRFACRLLMRSPGFTLTAVGVLASAWRQPPRSRSSTPSRCPGCRPRAGALSGSPAQPALARRCLSAFDLPPDGPR
jgi:hypothetical protein